MKYSIITINYNNKEGLRKTIESVIHQTFHDFEYIVIDGGSTDGSADVLKEYDKDINYWVSEKDKGIYNAMNKGIKVAHGEYLNFMNSGDMFHSSTVLEDITRMNSNDDIIIGICFDKENNVCHSIPEQDPTLLTMLKVPFNHQSMFFNKKLFTNRLYDENYTIMSDAKFNFQTIIIDNCSVKITDYIIADYDFNGISSNHELYERERQKFLNELFSPRILKDYERMFTPGEVPLTTLLSELKQHPSIQRLVYTFASFLIKCKHLIG